MNKSFLNPEQIYFFNSGFIPLISCYPTSQSGVATSRTREVLPPHSKTALQKISAPSWSVPTTELLIMKSFSQILFHQKL